MVNMLNDYFLFHIYSCLLIIGYVNTDSSGNPYDVEDIIDLDQEYLTYQHLHSNLGGDAVQYYFRSHRGESYRPLHRNNDIDLNTPLCYTQEGTFVCEKGTEDTTQFYHDPGHTVAVAIANENGTMKLTGVVNTKDATSELEPIQSKELPPNRYHVIKKRWTANIIQTNSRPYTHSRNSQDSDRNTYKTIPKPNVDELCVDILCVVDYSIYKKFKQKEKTIADTLKKIRYYYAHVINGINMRYATITDALSIKVRLAGYFVATGPKDLSFMDRQSMETDPNYRVDSNYTLTSLDEFLKTATGSWKPGELPEYNHAMLFLEYARTNLGGSVLGTSFVSGICSGSKGTSLVVDHGAYTSAGIGTHELGHNLGVFFHDGEGPVRSERCNASFNYIMAPASYLVDENNLRYSFTFSKCSIEQIKKHVDNLVKMKRNCLKCSERSRNQYKTRVIDNEVKGHMTTLPGEIEDVHSQCKQLYGDKSFMCPPRTPEEMCYRMYCYDPKRSACAIISEQMAAPGTPCGSYKICRMGKCVLDKPRGSDVPDDCPYPDIPSFGAHCEDASPFMCKNEKFRQKCCSSCNKSKGMKIDTVLQLIKLTNGMERNGSLQIVFPTLITFVNNLEPDATPSYSASHQATEFTAEEACKDSHILINGMTCEQLMTSVWGRPGCSTDYNVQNMCCLSCKKLLSTGSGTGGLLIKLGGSHMFGNQPGRNREGTSLRGSRNSGTARRIVDRSESGSRGMIRLRKTRTEVLRQPTNKTGGGSCEDSTNIKFNRLTCAELVKGNSRFCKDCTVQRVCCKSCMPFNSIYKC